MKIKIVVHEAEEEASGPIPVPAFAREASEGCHAGAQRAKAGYSAAGYGSASQPAVIIGTDSRKADAAPAPG